MDSSPAHILAPGLLWKSARDGFCPPGAIEGGYRSNNEPLYVARVLGPDRKYHPAKLARSHGAHYCYENQELTSSTYDVLVVSSDDVIILKWVKVSDGRVPVYAVHGEQDELYIGRHLVPEHNELVIGEVNTAESKCTVVTCWKAFKYSEYEVLCAFPHASTATQ